MTDAGETPKMEFPALYSISGSNADGPWRMLVKSRTPGAALEHAMTKKSWNVLDGVHISIEMDFYDMMEHEALAASAAELARSQPIPEGGEK